MSRTWPAHEHPDRPFDEWTWLDNCPRCRGALAREARTRPRLVLCIQTTTDRIYVTAEYLSDVLDAGGDVTALCWSPDDAVRGVFVVPDDRLWPPARWRSLRCEAHERAEGRVSFLRLSAPERSTSQRGLRQSA
jgi:hypothetical protein